jgi:hypothetical protein
VSRNQSSAQKNGFAKPRENSHGPPKDPASFMFWDAINNASTIAKSPGKSIPGLKWGRIDFLTEIELTSRWLLFK